MSSHAVDTDREQFYASIILLLRDLKPERDVPDPAPHTHLWVEGYVDSLGMLEIIYFLEEQLGREIELVGDFLPSFFTLESIYETYVMPSREAGVDRADRGDGG